MKFQKFFILKIISLRLAIWASFVFIYYFLINFFLFDLLNDFHELFFTFNIFNFLRLFIIQNIFKRYFFAGFMNSWWLSMTQFFQILNIFGCQSSRLLFTVIFSKLFGRRSYSILDSSVYLCFCMQRRNFYFHLYISPKSLNQLLACLNQYRFTKRVIPILFCLEETIWNFKSKGHRDFYFPKHVSPTCCLFMLTYGKNRSIITENRSFLLNNFCKSSWLEKARASWYMFRAIAKKPSFRRMRMKIEIKLKGRSISIFELNC